jgi:sec-independent protein translocase protein TatA
MFGGRLGMGELMIILLIVIVIFGAGKLPQIGEGLGKAITNFKKSVGGAKDEETPKENKSEKK